MIITPEHEFRRYEPDPSDKFDVGGLTGMQWIYMPLGDITRAQATVFNMYELRKLREMLMNAESWKHQRLELEPCEEGFIFRVEDGNQMVLTEDSLIRLRDFVDTILNPFDLKVARSLRPDPGDYKTMRAGEFYRVEPVYGSGTSYEEDLKASLRNLDWDEEPGVYFQRTIQPGDSDDTDASFALTIPTIAELCHAALEINEDMTMHRVTEELERVGDMHRKIHSAQPMTIEVEQVSRRVFFDDLGWMSLNQFMHILHNAACIVLDILESAGPERYALISTVPDLDKHTEGMYEIARNSPGTTAVSCDIHRHMARAMQVPLDCDNQPCINLHCFFATLRGIINKRYYEGGKRDE